MPGLEHPSTLANLVLTFWNQGRWKEAEELFVRAIETNNRVLGVEYPSTLKSMANLAFIFWSVDLKNEAIQLTSEVA